MPLRLATPPQSSAWRARHVVAGIVVVAAALLAVQQLLPGPRHRQEADAQPGPAARPAAAVTQAHAPWTILFERPRNCADECARVLDALASVARDPASGIPDGDARVVVKEAQGESARDLIVLDPEGNPAGFILHTTDAGRIVSGLATLRASAPANGTPIASR